MLASLIAQAQNVTPSHPITIYEVAKGDATPEIGMIEVALAAFGLTGVIMVSALVAGLTAGAAIIYFRGRRAVSTIEARGHEHNLFRA